MKEKNGNSSLDAKEALSGENANIDINSDSDIPGISHLREAMTNENEVDKLQSELVELKDKYLRLVAEFDNFRKRNAREKLELMQTAGRDVIVSLLDILDDCERAQKQLETAHDLGSVKEGILLVFNKLKNTLQSKGVKAMESINTDFDPDKHEAIAEIPVQTPELKGKVIDEVQKGYYLNDKIIRFAKVVVGNSLNHEFQKEGQ